MADVTTNPGSGLIGREGCGCQAPRSAQKASAAVTLGAALERAAGGSWNMANYRS
jgi:hypothetical protein